MTETEIYQKLCLLDPDDAEYLAYKKALERPVREAVNLIRSKRQTGRTTRIIVSTLAYISQCSELKTCCIVACNHRMAKNIEALTRRYAAKLAIDVSDIKFTIMPLDMARKAEYVNGYSPDYTTWLRDHQI